jgi:hypothetical protein
MGFRSDFYKLVEKYNNLPYMDEHVGVHKRGMHYNIRLKVERRSYSHTKPTHKDVGSLIEFMINKKGACWLPADNPTNSPQLIRFIDQNDNSKRRWCSVSLEMAVKVKMFSKQILTEVLKRSGPRFSIMQKT